MRKTIKKILFNFLYWSGVNYLYLKFKSRNFLLLLRYHSITNPSNKESLCAYLYKKISVEKREFEKQLLWLKNSGFNFITLDELVEFAKGHVQLKPKSVLIYFDDGFRDVILNAYPFLKNHKIPASLFLTTDFVDQRDALWSIKIRYIISTAKQNHVYFNDVRFDLDTPQQRKEASEKIIKIGKLEMGDVKAIEETKKMEIDLGINTSILSSKIFANWDEIKNVADVFKFGSHTLRHRKLTRIPLKEAREVLFESKIRIEEMLGSKIEAFSFPHGGYNEDIIEMAKEVGYKLLITTDAGFNYFDSFDPFRVKSTKAPEEFKALKLELGILAWIRDSLKPKSEDDYKEKQDIL